MKFWVITTILLMSFLNVKAVDKETVYLQGSQGKLYTLVEKPNGIHKGDKIPVVILCHGFGGNCENVLWDNLSKDILEKGIGVVRFDFNGHGKSDGKFQDMTVLNEIEDLKDVISWTQKQEWCKNISLVGHSQGGVVVSMTSGELGQGVIKAEVLMAPAAVLRDDAIRGNTMGAIYDPYNLKDDYVELPFSTPEHPVRLGRKYIESAISLPIYETSEKYTGPVLIIHGTYDRIVPFTYGERYHHDITNSTLKLVDGEDHGFSKSYKETNQEVADWLSGHLL